MNPFLIIFGKLIIFFCQTFNLGSGSTWPGHIALKLNPNFVKDVLASHPWGGKPRIVVIAGTNGKTTTGRLISEILKSNNKSVLHNEAGANLLNGLASCLIKGASFAKFHLSRLNYDYLIFESDENAFPSIVAQTIPDYIVCLNLFRDQLDRYGEIDTVAKKWQVAINKLSNKTTLILNADDPQIAFLSNKTRADVKYFGLEEKGKGQTKHGADTIYCPKCFGKLEFEKVFFSHLGVWRCPDCKLTRPNPAITKLPHYPLPGTYNKYNSLAASLLAKTEGVDDKSVDKLYTNFTPAFGRQEKMDYRGKNVQIFLSKNPTSFNESLQTIKDLGGKNLLILLNDRIPDGLDVSWIWDINLEEVLPNFKSITVSGDRAYDMGLRIKYSTSSQFQIEPDLQNALSNAIENFNADQFLYILANYSAMLDVRKILTGRRIL